MKQKRLGIFARKISAEEVNFSHRIKIIENKIRVQLKGLKEMKREYRSRYCAQQKNGLQCRLDVSIKENRIDELINRKERFIKKLKKELIDLKNHTGTVQKDSSKQTDIFNITKT